MCLVWDAVFARSEFDRSVRLIVLFTRRTLLVRQSNQPIFFTWLLTHLLGERYGQTEPPTIPVEDLFEEGSFPEGEILEHARDFNSFRVRRRVAWPCAPSIESTYLLGVGRGVSPAFAFVQNLLEVLFLC